MFLRNLAVALASLLPLYGHAAANLNSIKQAVDSAVIPSIAEFDVPGMAVAVTVDGNARFFNYGVASRIDQTAVHELTLFELGSVSKTFTAMLAAQAIDQGRLSLSDHPGKFLPSLRGHPIDKATMLHLGTYSAGGLPLQLPEDVRDEVQLMHYYQQWQPVAEPGMLRAYSNSSLGLLGRVAALAFEQNFSELMQDQLFLQLGLRNTYVHVPASAMSNYAWGYGASNQPGRVNDDQMLASETYGVKSSSADMIRFVQLNIDATMVDASLRRAIDGTHIGYLKSGVLVQGLGWEQYSWPTSLERLLSGNSASMIWQGNPSQIIDAPQLPTDPTLFNKTGSTSNFGAYVAFVPARKIGVVLLANRNYPISERIKAGHAILVDLEKLSTSKR